MSSLRRDLLERKLWVVVALLAIALAAVPVLLLKGTSAGATPTVTAPRAAVAGVPTATTAHATAAVPARVALAGGTRNPFAGGASTSSSTTASQSSSTTATPALTATTPPSSSTPTVAMVSPAPATSSSQSSGTESSSTTTSTSTPSTTTPTSTVASASSAPTTTPQSWTTHAVSVRFGKDLTAPVRTNVARLTPLPNVMQPEVMFMGIVADGRTAVFALHAGLGHTGPGLCRPDHTRCSAILLRAGQTEHLTIATAAGGPRTLVLRVVKVTSSITHSRKVALAAYRRVNAAGQCELDLANPVSYDAATGTISSVAKDACERHPRAVPFGYLVTAP